MISVIRTTNGTYNIIGTRAMPGGQSQFVIQGNLTDDELYELVEQIKDVRGLRQIPRITAG